MLYTIKQQEFFKGISKIKYEGPESDNPLAYRWYDENKIVSGKPLKSWLRFACAYWHSFCGSGADPFGDALPGVQLRRCRQAVQASVVERLFRSSDIRV
jgi:xylose isomerase